MRIEEWLLFLRRTHGMLFHGGQRFSTCRHAGFKRFYLAGVLCFFAAWSGASGDVVGDAELFQTVMAVREHNNGKVLTWQGTVQITSRGKIPQFEFVDTKRTEFTLDMTTESLLWWDTITEAKRLKEGALVDIPEMLEVRSTMWLRNGLYELKPIYHKEGSTVKDDGLVIWPADIAEGRLRFSREFDPRNYLSTWEGQDIDQMLATAYRVAISPEAAQRSIEREGQEVIYRCGNGDYTWCYTFDLSKGGSLVAAEYSGLGDHSRFEYEFVEIDGVWLPKAYRARQDWTIPTGEEAFRESEVQFVENVLNEDLPESAFTLEALGVKQDCGISDQRIGAFYYYGGRIDLNLPDSLTQMDKLLEIPAAIPNEAHPSPEIAETNPSAQTASEESSDATSMSTTTHKERTYWPYIVVGVLAAVVVIAMVISRRSRRQ